MVQYDVYNVTCGRIIDENKCTVRRTLNSIWKRLAGSKPIASARCTELSLCRDCAIKRRRLCDDYHLYNRSWRIVSALKYYYKSVPDRVIYRMYEIAVGNVERDLRNYYEKLYIGDRVDGAHEYFTNHVLPKSFTYDSDPALGDAKFWDAVLYTAVIETYSVSSPASYYYGGESSPWSGSCIVHQTRGQTPVTAMRRAASAYDTRDGADVYEYFKMYLRSNKHVDVSAMHAYNLDYDGMVDVYRAFTIHSCRLMLIANKLPMSLLFDENYISVVNVDGSRTVLNIFLEEIYDSLYLYLAENARPRPCDYLDLSAEYSRIIEVKKNIDIYQTFIF